MGLLLCNPNCPGGVASAPQNYQDLCQPIQFIRHGYNGYAVVNSDAGITDITNLAQWQAALDAGTVGASPCGYFTLGVPTSNTSNDIDPCKDDVVTETVYQPTFHTYNLDCDNFSHCQYFKDLADRSDCNNIVYFDCKGNVYANAATNESGELGFDYTIIQAPHPENGDNNNEKWVTQFQIKQPGIFVPCPTPVPGLYDLLYGIAAEG